MRGRREGSGEEKRGKQIAVALPVSLDQLAHVQVKRGRGCLQRQLSARRLNEGLQQPLAGRRGGWRSDGERGGGGGRRGGREGGRVEGDKAVKAGTHALVSVEGDLCRRIKEGGRWGGRDGGVISLFLQQCNQPLSFPPSPPPPHLPSYLPIPCPPPSSSPQP